MSHFSVNNSLHGNLIDIRLVNIVLQTVGHVLCLYTHTISTHPNGTVARSCNLVPFTSRLYVGTGPVYCMLIL